MLHKKRKHAVKFCASIKDMVNQLRHYDWTACTAFQFDKLIMANDSTSPDGAQEYVAVINGRQVESLTVSWFASDEDLEYTLTNLANGFGPDGDPQADYGAVEIGGHDDRYCHHCR